MVVVALATACGSNYDDPQKCDVFDPSNERLAACMANTPPWYCGDSGFPHRYQNKSDHVCSKAELDTAKIAREVRPVSQR